MFIKLLLLYLYRYSFSPTSTHFEQEPIWKGGVEARGGEAGFFFRLRRFPMQNGFRWTGRFVQLLQELHKTALGVLVGLEKALWETPPFAVCQGHTVKPLKPTANPLPCAAHGKAHTATRDRQSRPLSCAIYRAHGKGFAVCHSRPTAK